MNQLNLSMGERRIFTDEKFNHSHNSGHLIIPMKGNLFICAKNCQTLDLNENHLLLLPPSYEHTFYANQGNEFLVFYIQK